MTEIIKKAITLIIEFFRYRKSNNDMEFFKYKRNKETMKNRVKIRKRLREISKKGNLSDLLLIIFLISFVGCKSVTVYPTENYEGRYDNLELLKTNINNIKDKNINIWVMKAETLDKIIDNIYNELKCN